MSPWYSAAPWTVTFINLHKYTSMCASAAVAGGYGHGLCRRFHEKVCLCMRYLRVREKDVGIYLWVVRMMLYLQENIIKYAALFFAVKEEKGGYPWRIWLPEC